MLSDFLFFKSSKINIPENQKKDFYGNSVSIVAEDCQKNPDWKKIRELEEKQWPVLSQLDNPGLSFFSESLADKEAVRKFINLILDEKKARINQHIIGEENYNKEIDRTIKERMKFLKMMLEITEEDISDFRKSKKRWWLALAGAVAVLGFYGVRKLVKNDKNKNGEDKK